MTDLGLEEKREHKQSKIHFSKALFSPLSQAWLPQCLLGVKLSLSLLLQPGDGWHRRSAVVCITFCFPAAFFAYIFCSTALCFLLLFVCCYLFLQVFLLCCFSVPFLWCGLAVGHSQPEVSLPWCGSPVGCSHIEVSLLQCGSLEGHCPSGDCRVFTIAISLCIVPCETCFSPLWKENYCCASNSSGIRFLNIPGKVFLYSLILHC